MLTIRPLIRPKKEQLRRAAEVLGVPLTNENIPLICKQIDAAIDDGLTQEETQAAPSRLFLVSGGG